MEEDKTTNNTITGAKGNHGWDKYGNANNYEDTLVDGKPICSLFSILVLMD
jgi:hypothetical protein